MRLQTSEQKDGWREIWSRSQLGSKLSANISPAGTAVSIGITNTLALTGVSNTIGADEARELAMALLQFADSADELEMRAAIANATGEQA